MFPWQLRPWKIKGLPLLWGLMVGLELQFFRWAGRDFLLDNIFIDVCAVEIRSWIQNQTSRGYFKRTRAAQQLLHRCVCNGRCEERTMFALCEMSWRFFNYACGFNVSMHLHFLLYWKLFLFKQVLSVIEYTDTSISNCNCTSHVTSSCIIWPI